MQKVNDHTVIISTAKLIGNLSNEKITDLVSQLIFEEKKLPKGNFLVLMDSGAVAGMNHLKACIHFALQSFEQKNNTAKSLGAEILLYISGYRQISRAIENVGLNINTTDLLLLQISKQSDDMKPFDFQSFLKKQKLEIKDYSHNIDSFTITNELKLRKNLEILDEEINLYLDSESKQEILEKYAIERSASLNLIK